MNCKRSKRAHNYLDLTGDRYGRWRVVTEAEPGLYADVRWHCVCDCGNVGIVSARSLRSGNSRSCGCFKVEAAQMRLCGDRSRHPLEYRNWCLMKRRCLNYKDISYHNYGGRGITICERWEASFAAFYEDMGPRPTLKHQLDRIRNEEGYWCGKQECPECGPLNRQPNCRWVTKKQQNRNTRRTVFITYKGATKSLGEWAEELGLGIHTLGHRIRTGWTPEEALEMPPLKSGRRKQHRISFNGQTHTIGEWAKLTGLSYSTILNRFTRGDSAEKILTQPHRSKRKNGGGNVD